MRDWLAANAFILSMPVFCAGLFFVLAKAVILMDLSFEDQAIGASALVSVLSTYFVFKSLLRRLS
jgi:hypothetical protein